MQKAALASALDSVMPFVRLLIQATLTSNGMQKAALASVFL
jgi:hypothetical protein